LYPDRDFTGLGPEQRALHADHVAQIEQFHHLVRLGADVVDLEVDLNLRRAVFQVPEGGLAHGAQQNEPSREPMDGRVVVPELLERRRDRAGAVEPIGERHHAALH